MGAAGRRGNLKRDRSPDPGSDVEEEPFAWTPIDNIELWSDYWSEELAETYHTLQDQCQRCGYAFLEKCTFPEFVEFAFQNSSRLPPPV